MTNRDWLLEQEARDDADRALLAQLVSASAKLDRLQAHVVRLEARLARSAVASGGASGRHTEMAMRSMAAEVAGALRISRRTAASRLEQSLETTTIWRDLLGAQERGRITAAQSRAVQRGAGALIDTRVDQKQRAAFVAEMLQEAGTHARVPGKLERIARLRAERVTNAPITRRHEEALQDRHVRVAHAGDGMAWLTAYLPAYQAEAIEQRLRVAATSRKHVDDPRTSAQWRADAFAAVLLTGDATFDVAEHTPSPGDVPMLLRGIEATVEITVPALSLSGIDVHRDGLDPAMLAGKAPMSLEVALALTGRTRHHLTRVLTDPVTGLVVAADSHDPRADLRRFLRARDRSICREPTCSARAADHDHTVAWESGGITVDANLGGLCKSGHTLKHATRWRLRQPVPGIFKWTSPLGHVHRDQPLPAALPFSDRALLHPVR